MANKDTSKGWFETGDFPTQAQFAQVFDWQSWKDEPIGVLDLSTELRALLNLIDVAPLEVVVTGWAGSYTIPAGYAIHRIYARLSTGFSIITAGDSAGAADIINETDLTAGITAAIDVTIIADIDRTVYFSIDTEDETTQTFLKIYIHKI